MEVLNYKGFRGTYKYSDEDNFFFGSLEGIEDLVTFQVKDENEIEKAFRDAVEDYILLCKEVGK